MIERAFAVSLAIPDNEAYTALVTLRGLGVPCAGIERADIHVFGVESAAADELIRLVPTIATIYNPNKHRLTVLDQPRPSRGEVWITEGDLPQPRAAIVVGGVRLPGVQTMWHATAWRLSGADGKDVAPEVLGRAVETLLCNPAFQRAIQ